MQRFLLRSSQNSQPQQISETQQAATNPNKIATKQPLSPSQQQSRSPSQGSLDSSPLTHTGSASKSADVTNLRSPESLGPLSYGSMSVPEEELSTSVKSEQTSNETSIPTEPAADSTTAAPTTTTSPGNSFLTLVELDYCSISHINN